MWDSFARHLKLDEDFIAENYLFASGGGSPSQRFMLLLRQRRPHITVRIFQSMLEMHQMNDISTMLDGEQCDLFCEYINWRIEESICSRLNTPREEPRWKMMAITRGFSPSEIEEIARAVHTNNLFIPTTRILNAYKWHFQMKTLIIFVNLLLITLIVIDELYPKYRVFSSSLSLAYNVNAPLLS